MTITYSYISVRKVYFRTTNFGKIKEKHVMALHCKPIFLFYYACKFISAAAKANREKLLIARAISSE